MTQEPIERISFREQASVRGEFIATIILDTLVVIVAVLARWTALWVIRRVAPGETQGWAVHWLERIADYGIVLAALAFAIFDFLKRVVREVKAFLAEVQS